MAMRYLIPFLLLLILSGCRSAPHLVLSLPEDIRELKLPLKTKPLISAHRGGKYIDAYPENCLETFQHISASHNFIIECDIAQSADGVFFLMHDNTLDRTTTGNGPVAGRDWAELSALSLKDHRGTATAYKVPSLKSVLEWAKGEAFLSLDIKKGVNKRELLNFLAEFDAYEFVEIITYSVKDAELIHRLAPEYVISMNIRNKEEWQRALESSVARQKIKAFIGTRKKSPEFLNLLANNGVISTLGTLGNLDKQAKKKGLAMYQTWVDEGVQVFATDYPLEVAHYFYRSK